MPRQKAQEQTGDAYERTPPGLVRTTVNLLAKSVQDLEELQRRTGLNQTDCINRGVQAYNLLEQVQARGASLVIREQDGSETRIKFL
jgi:hypothetical protein